MTLKPRWVTRLEQSGCLEEESGRDMSKPTGLRTVWMCRLADLFGATLNGANLQKTNLDGANLREAILDGADPTKS